MTDPVSEKILQIDARLLKPDEMRSPDELFRELMVRVRRYHPSGDLSGIEKASLIYSNAGNLILPLVPAILGEEWLIYASAFILVLVIINIIQPIVQI